MSNYDIYIISIVLVKIGFIGLAATHLYLKHTGKTNSKKEKFQTVKTRSFDPSKEEDTNFLITKEILQDMVNRIDYNFESSRYLKKYLKHRIEEIVDMNKLLDDDYDD